MKLGGANSPPVYIVTINRGGAGTLADFVTSDIATGNVWNFVIHEAGTLHVTFMNCVNPPATGGFSITIDGVSQGSMFTYAGNYLRKTFPVKKGSVVTSGLSAGNNYAISVGIYYTS